jgi:hypothetical protein
MCGDFHLSWRKNIIYLCLGIWRYNSITKQYRIYYGKGLQLIVDAQTQFLIMVGDFSIII